MNTGFILVLAVLLPGVIAVAMWHTLKNARVSDTGGMSKFVGFGLFILIAAIFAAIIFNVLE